MAISAHMTSDRTGYCVAIDGEEVPEGSEASDREADKPQGNGSYDNPNHHAQTGEVSPKTVGYLGYRIDDACKVVVAAGTAPSSAKKVVRQTLNEIYKEEWGELPDWANLSGMTQGQVSSLIALTKTTWEL